MTGADDGTGAFVGGVGGSGLRRKDSTPSANVYILVSLGLVPAGTDASKQVEDLLGELSS